VGVLYLRALGLVLVHANAKILEHEGLTDVHENGHRGLDQVQHQLLRVLLRHVDKGVVLLNESEWGVLCLVLDAIDVGILLDILEVVLEIILEIFFIKV